MKLLTAKQLSAETGLALSYIYRLVESEQIPFIRPRGGRQRARVLFRRERILEWLQGLENQPKEPPSLRS